MIFRLNPTGVKRFGRCEAEWHHHSVSQVYRIRPQTSSHRDRGKVFHALLEHALLAYAEHGRLDVYEGEEGRTLARAVGYNLWQRDRTSVDDETMWSLWRATQYHLKRLRLPEWEVVRDAEGSPMVELDLRGFLQGLPDNVEVQSKVDVVLRHRATGKVWLIDFKTTVYPLSVLELPAFVEHDDQLLIGRWLLESRGITVDYAALLHLRSQAPQAPGLVYRGKPNERLCRDVNKLACDWPTYEAALLEREEDPGSADNRKVREGLEPFVFVRWQVDCTSPEGLVVQRRNLAAIAERMNALANGATPLLRLDPSKSPSGCRRCDYYRWCTAALRNGGEPDLRLLSTDYEAGSRSPLAGKAEIGEGFDPSRAYVEWARQQGRQINALDDFTPWTQGA